MKRRTEPTKNVRKYGDRSVKPWEQVTQPAIDKRRKQPEKDSDGMYYGECYIPNRGVDQVNRDENKQGNEKDKRQKKKSLQQNKHLQLSVMNSRNIKSLEVVVKICTWNLMKQSKSLATNEQNQP